MKIIFLDFDGVLNYEAYYASRLNGGLLYVPDDFPYSEICPITVERLNRICEHTGAKVVISSTWRHGRTLEQLHNILARRGFTGEVIGKTADFRDSGEPKRGSEIQKWIDENKPENYVILDDDGDMLDGQKFLQTTFQTGLTDEIAEKAIQILDSPPFPSFTV